MWKAKDRRVRNKLRRVKSMGRKREKYQGVRVKTKRAGRRSQKLQK